MSHFLCYAFVPDRMPLYRTVEELLEPYSELDERYFVLQPVKAEKLTGLEQEFYPGKTLADIAKDQGWRLVDGWPCYWNNPNTKWDWYGIGEGFCEDLIVTTDGRKGWCCQVRELGEQPERPFAMVTSDGEWYECGRAGWFGLSDATEESTLEFERIFWQYCDEHSDEWVVAVNCHI